MRFSLQYNLPAANYFSLQHTSCQEGVALLDGFLYFYGDT